MGLLDNQIAIITGEASPPGLGKACARLLAEHGAQIVIMYLDQKQAKGAAHDLPGSGHLGLGGNVCDLENCARVIKLTLEQFGRIDILVNNAGITQPLKLMDILPLNYEAVTCCFRG